MILLPGHGLATKLSNWELHVERLKGISSKNVHVLSQNSNDTNVMWKTVRSCNSDDDKSIADRLNQLFTSAGKTMNQKITACSWMPLRSSCKPATQNFQVQSNLLICMVALIECGITCLIFLFWIVSNNNNNKGLGELSSYSSTCRLVYSLCEIKEVTEIMKHFCLLFIWLRHIAIEISKNKNRNIF